MTAPAKYENGIKVRRIRCDECGSSVSSPFVGVEHNIDYEGPMNQTFVMSAYVLCVDCYEKLNPEKEDGSN